MGQKLNEAKVARHAQPDRITFFLMQPFRPYAPGFCILVRRELHEVIGGFDETLRLSEGLDYVRRAARHGRFGILTSTRIAASVRRIRKEGMLRLGMKYLWCEKNLWRGRPVREIPFEYEFGAFPPPAERKRSAVHFAFGRPAAAGCRDTWAVA